MRSAVEGSPSIHPPFEAFYIEGMLWHTSSAKRSIELVGEWLEFVRNEDSKALDLSKSELFDQLQNILLQAGCISRYLFPVRKQPLHIQRADRLREGLQIAHDNPLAERRLRDAIEHFDERLDNYLAREQIGHFVPQDVGYVPPESEVPLHIFKGFYTHQLIFVLLGERFEMAPIVNETLRIHEALLQCVQEGSRLPYRQGHAD